MRRALLICLALGALVGPSADAVPVRRVDAGHGLSVVLPSGWRLAHARISTCADPLQRLVAVTGRVRLHPGMKVPQGVAIVLVQEAWMGLVPRRPAHFVLGRLGQLAGCCEMPRGTGAELMFRVHGREFYVFAYATSAAQRRDALALLNSLRVSPEAVAGA
jgi:hypothetical protein